MHHLYTVVKKIKHVQRYDYLQLKIHKFVKDESNIEFIWANNPDEMLKIIPIIQQGTDRKKCLLFLHWKYFPLS